MGAESRQVPSSTAQDRGACRPTTSVPCGEHACTPNVNRGSMSVSYCGKESDVVIVVHDSESETGSISPETSPENRQARFLLPRIRRSADPWLGFNVKIPYAGLSLVSLRRLDMPLDREQRYRVLVISQREECVIRCQCE